MFAIALWQFEASYLRKSLNGRPEIKALPSFDKVYSVAMRSAGEAVEMVSS
jgi:hypothetical protein